MKLHSCVDVGRLDCLLPASTHGPYPKTSVVSAISHSSDPITTSSQYVGTAWCTAGDQQASRENGDI